MSRLDQLGGYRSDLHTRRLVSGAASALSMRVAGMLASFAFLLLVSRGLGPEAVGIFAVSNSLLMSATMIVLLGLDSATVRFVAESSATGTWSRLWSYRRRTLQIIVPLGLVLTGLMVGFAPVVADRLFQKPHLAHPTQVVALAVVPAALLFVNAEALRGLQHVAAYTFFRTAGVPLVGCGLVGLALWVLPTTVNLPVYAHVVAMLGLAGVSARWWRRAVQPHDSHRAAVGVSFSQVLQVSVPMFLTASMFLAMQWTDILVLGIYGTVSDVGVYNVASRVANLGSIFLFAIASIAGPTFAGLFATADLETLQRVMRQSTLATFWLSAPVLFTILLIPSTILAAFGLEFREGATALVVLTLGQFVNAMSGCVGNLLQMTRRERAFQYIALVTLATNLGLNFALIPRLGINGAALATAISFVLWNLTSVVYIRRHYGFWTIRLF